MKYMITDGRNLMPTDSDYYGVPTYRIFAHREGAEAELRKFDEEERRGLKIEPVALEAGTGKFRRRVY